MSEIELVPLSASRIKTYKECSWKYYCNYILKLPDTSNDGASKGWICHLILECLFVDRRKALYKSVIKKKSLLAIPSIKKLIEKWAGRLNLNLDGDVMDINIMTMNALRSDFFGKKKKGLHQSFAEQDFDMIVREGGKEYRVKGFIDQMFLYADGSAVIRDFKSSKKMFEGKEIEDNLQDFIYTLYAKRVHGIKKVHSEFLFLRFDLEKDGVIRMKPISDEEHDGFEIELTAIQRKIQNFDEESAYQNFAARANYPTDKSFSGPLMCGRATSPTTLKKDGTKMWHCPFKFGFFYYCVVEKETNKIVKSVFEPKLEEMKAWLSTHPKKETLALKKRRYRGCPAFANLNRTLDSEAGL